MLEKAKEIVIKKGYKFVKGQSRGSSKELSDNSGGEQRHKRKKIDKNERLKEIQSIKDVINNINEQLQFKKLRLQKQKSLNQFSICDQISGEITTLMKEKKIQEKQLSLLEKREKKSAWYHTKRRKNQSTSSNKKNKGQDLRQMWKNKSSSTSNINVSDSNESGETVIVSSDNEQTISSANQSVHSEADQSNAESKMDEIDDFHSSPPHEDDQEEEEEDGNQEKVDHLLSSQHVEDQSSDQSENPENPEKELADLVPSKDF